MRIIQLNRRSDIRQDLIPDMRTSVKDFFKVFYFRRKQAEKRSTGKIEGVFALTDLITVI